MAETFGVIVLAAQRPGVVNPLAERAGVSHKCLVPICGKPLIQHVFEILALSPRVERVRVSVEPEVFEPVSDLARALADRGIPVDYVAAQPSITDSVYAAAQGLDGSFLVTTADNVNMTPDAMHATMDAVREGADVSLALATREAVLAARGEVASEKTKNVGPYRFADGRFSNCNLYGFAGRDVLKAAEMFREGGQFSKDRGRLIRAVGFVNVVIVALRLVTLKGAMKRLSGRLGVRIEAVVLDDGSQAIDVDNFRTYDLAGRILARKAQI